MLPTRATTQTGCQVPLLWPSPKNVALPDPLKPFNNLTIPTSSKRPNYASPFTSPTGTLSIASTINLLIFIAPMRGGNGSSWAPPRAAMCLQSPKECFLYSFYVNLHSLWNIVYCIIRWHMGTHGGMGISSKSFYGISYKWCTLHKITLNCSRWMDHILMSIMIDMSCS